MTVMTAAFEKIGFKATRPRKIGWPRRRNNRCVGLRREVSTGAIVEKVKEN